MQSTLDIPYSETRNRVTVLVRIILVIPHLVVYYVLNIAAQNATGAHETSVASDQLARLATDLNGMVQRFRL